MDRSVKGSLNSRTHRKWGGRGWRQGHVVIAGKRVVVEVVEVQLTREVDADIRRRVKSRTE